VAGYSGTPLPQKLGIKPGARLALVGAPAGFALGSLPAGVKTCIGMPRATCDVIVAFFQSQARLVAAFPRLDDKLAARGGLWIAWPKKASGVATDLDESKIRDLALSAGLVDNKVCAIDDVWSGLRIVVRVADRAARG
jgi:hypothetical protein